MGVVSSAVVNLTENTNNRKKEKNLCEIVWHFQKIF